MRLVIPTLFIILISCIGHANAQHLVIYGPFKFLKPQSHPHTELQIQHKQPVDNITLIQNHIQALQNQLKTLQDQKVLEPVLAYDKEKGCSIDQHSSTNYLTYLTHFSCGHVSVASNGTVYRHFTLIANDYHFHGIPVEVSLNKTDPVIFHAWLFNNSFPGPTMRMTVGDHVTINLFNSNESAMAHGLHMHSIHSGYNDGVPGISPGGLVFPGGNFTFHFIANPVGVFPYHCHMAPIEEHIQRGLYGMMIIDPTTMRPPAKEMVMMLGGLSWTWQGLDGNGPPKPSIPCTAEQMRKNMTGCMEETSDSSQPDNQAYFVNGMPFGYDPMHGGKAIHLNVGTHYRIYLVNMLEFEPVNSFHIHGTMFYYTSSGSFASSLLYTDILTLAQADRGILQFTYPFPGEYMIHSHIAHISDLGWTGFLAVDNDRSYGFFH